MKTQLADPVRYYMQIEDSDEHCLNDYIGKQITLKHLGEIFCIQCGRKTSKSFQQGYCFPCMRRINECGNCMIHPERCLVEQGGCDEHDWAHVHCHQEHFVYLANSSALKVGITRHTQIPTRWIDQGAQQALPIFKVANRYQSGLVEVALKQYVNDKTNWRTMLKQESVKMDLLAERERLLKEAHEDLATILQQYPQDIEPIIDVDVAELSFPVTQYPTKVSSLSLDKTPEITAVLVGIKGQYLILDKGVINLRKFGGYNVEFLV